MSALYDVIQMDQWIAKNSKVFKLCGHFQDIYDWISQLNKNRQTYGLF